MVSSRLLLCRRAGLSEHRSACLGRGGYCLRPGFCGLGEDLLQCLLAVRRSYGIHWHDRVSFCVPCVTLTLRLYVSALFTRRLCPSETEIVSLKPVRFCFSVTKPRAILFAVNKDFFFSFTSLLWPPRAQHAVAQEKHMQIHKAQAPDS